jgi:hypothetical protein
MTYALVSKPALFITFTVAKAIYDVVTLLIRVEASGVLPKKYKDSLIDDMISVISFIIYVGG